MCFKIKTALSSKMPIHQQKQTNSDNTKAHIDHAWIMTPATSHQPPARSVDQSERLTCLQGASSVAATSNPKSGGWRSAYKKVNGMSSEAQKRRRTYALSTGKGGKSKATKYMFH